MSPKENRTRSRTSHVLRLLWAASTLGRLFASAGAAAFLSARPVGRVRFLKTSDAMHQHHQENLVPRQPPTIHRRNAPFLSTLSLSGNENTNTDEDNGQEDDDDNENSPSSPGRLRRKRDIIKKLLRSPSSPMVRPIRIEDGSIVDDASQLPSPRFKPNFSDLFYGMPSIKDILGDDVNSQSGSNGPIDTSFAKAGGRKQKNRQQNGESWFEEEKKQVEADYDDILKNMLAKLEELRLQDREGVPSNAEAMIKDVLRQEMKMEIATRKEARAKGNLVDYANRQKEEIELKNMTGVSSPVVDDLMQRDQAAREKAEVAQERVDDYRRYELETFQRTPDQDDNVPLPDASADLDQWALERLQDMVDSRQAVDDEFIVTDILEDNMEDLRLRMEREASRSSGMPETMKEWQMYRAIASRLGMQRDSEGFLTQLDDESVSEEQIAAQLTSWKEYLAKEDEIRKRSGLARGPKLPFQWQESDYDKAKEDAQVKACLESQGEKTIVEIRKEVNRKSVEALRELSETSAPVHRERLRKDLELLKQELEAKDYLDIDASLLEEQEEVPTGPVDIKDMFTSTDDREISMPFDKSPGVSRPSPPPPPRAPLFDGKDKESRSSFLSSEDGDFETKPPPPSTPFFQADDDTSATAEPPGTPFFSFDVVTECDDEENLQYRLGSAAEQKLRAMYQRAGARTDEEKATIRAQWEEFQQFEKSRRDESGLTDGDDSQLLSKADIKYDMSEVTKHGGDFDAEKILASIGPRPSSNKKSGAPVKQSDSSSKNTAKDIYESKLDPMELSDSLYRAVSAVGGGRTKGDPASTTKAKAAFTEFIEKENELRQSLDKLDEAIAEEVSNNEGTFDDLRYAENAIASLGPRPKPKRRKLSEAEHSDKGIALSDTEDDNTYRDDDTNETQTASREPTPIDKIRSEDDYLPAWLVKERARGESSGGRDTFLGSDIDDVFDDDGYEHNMRQLAEYERCRAGGKKQMGIDISEALGRSSDDYAEYNVDDDYFRAKKSGWGAAGFETRKATLEEYTELDVMELNSLMDHKDSVVSTGVSQYLPRINKPFTEFGAIFRLEGVLIDTTGFQYRAWSFVAAEMDFKSPSIDDVRRAAVLRPAVAVRDVFYWTDDILLCQEVATAHKKALQEVFNNWMKEAGVSLPVPVRDTGVGRVSLPIGDDTNIPSRLPEMDPWQGVTEKEKIKRLADAWSRTAVEHRLNTPSREQVEMASVLSPDIAVNKVFRWSVDEGEIDKFVTTYRSIMKNLMGSPEKDASNGGREPAAPRVEVAAPSPTQQSKVLDSNSMMELQFKAWTKLAESNGFEFPESEEVLAAITINDLEIAIRDGFRWTEDSSLISVMISSYKESLEAFIKEWKGEATNPSGSSLRDPHEEMNESQEQRVAIRNDRSLPAEEEMLEMQQHAWKSAALNHGFQAPLADQMQLAMMMTPSEAVTRLFRWSSDELVVKAVCATYSSALKDISHKYIRKYRLQPDVVLFPLQSDLPAPANPFNDASDDADIFQISMNAWTAVAKKKGFELPDEDQILFAMSVGPEEAVISGFEWVRESGDVQEIVDSFKAEFRDLLVKEGFPNGETQESAAGESVGSDSLPLYSVVCGAEKWLTSLFDVDMRCSVISYLTREQLDVLLGVTGLSHLFAPDRRVSADNNYARDVDQLLGAALRNERRPDHCVVFDSSPHASVAAHYVGMRSVGVIGAFPRYDLLSADSTASSFDELTAMNIRRLFGERVFDQPMVDMQQADPEGSTRTKTNYFWDDD